MPDMAVKSGVAGRASFVKGAGRGKSSILHLRVTPELLRRVKYAAADEHLAYDALIESLLDLREDRLRRRAARQVSPLHRPNEADEDDA